MCSFIYWYISYFQYIASNVYMFKLSLGTCLFLTFKTSMYGEFYCVCGENNNSRNILKPLSGVRKL